MRRRALLLCVPALAIASQLPAPVAAVEAGDVVNGRECFYLCEACSRPLFEGGKPLDYYCVLVRDRILYLMQRLWAQEVKYQARVTELLAANNVEVERRRAAEAMCQHILSKLKEPPSAYLIWSNEHRLWWRPQSAGYTASLETAGRYSREEAVKICRNARGGWKPGEPPPEVPVRETDAL